MTPPPRAGARTAELRDLLLRSGLTRTGVHDRLGGVGDLLAKASELPLQLRRLGESDTAAVLIRLLVLGVDVDETRARELVDARLLDMLVDAGLVALEGARLHAVTRVIPHYDDVLVAADKDEDTPDFVPGVQRPSAALADLTVRRRVERALDVGTGCGIQALLLARHASHVVATDVNERALAYAAFNAALNGVENVEFRAGSFFEPVEGERFGVVVSNPPYVISPETAYVFRDSGLAGGRVAERVVGDLPRHLEDGGYGTVLVSWPQEGDDLGATPRGWLEGSECDAWAFYTAVDDPLTTAAAWNREHSHDPGLYAQAIDRWLAYYAEAGIGSLAYAAIVLRRRPGAATWFRARPLPAERGAASPQLERMFAAQDLLAGLDDDELLVLRPSLVSEARLTQVVAVADGALALREATLRLADGIGFAAELDANTFAIVRRFDGTRSLREVAAEVGLEADVSEEDAVTATARLGRQLLELGFAEVPPR